jgi:hypothetical protein
VADPIEQTIESTVAKIGHEVRRYFPNQYKRQITDTLVAPDTLIKIIESTNMTSSDILRHTFDDTTFIDYY